MGSGTVTMKHLAEHLGVSITTVSNAYNRPERLSAALREKILGAGKELGYCGPDAVGRLLRRGKSDAIGVHFGTRLSSVFSDPYASQLMAGITEVLEDAGMGLNLLGSRGVDPADSVRQALVDAVIFLGERPTVLAAAEVADLRGLRTVFTHRVAGADHAAIDDQLSGRVVGAHLASLGHRRVGVITAWVSGPGRQLLTLADLESRPEGHRSFWELRLQGLLEGLGEGAVIDLVARPLQSANVGRLATGSLLDADQPPTAIVAMSDAMALGVLDEAAARGLVAGRDLSITGFDGLEIAEARGLTTVTQPIVEKGRMAARLAVDPDLSPRQVLLPVQLAQRTSTGPVPAGVAQNR